MNITFLDLILFVLFFQLLTLVPYLLFQKTNRGLSNKLLAAFLIAKALCVTNFLAFRLYDYSFEFFPHGFYFGMSFTILWGPLLYLYIKSFTQIDFKLSRIDIIHFIPFLAHFSWLLISYHLNGAEQKRIIMEAGGLINRSQWAIFYNVLYAYTLIYLTASVPPIKNYHNALRNNHSNIDAKNLNWLTIVLVGFSAKIFFDIWAQMGSYETFGDIPTYLSRLTLFVFLNILVFKSLKQPSLLNGDLINDEEKKNSLSKTSQTTYLKTIQDYVEINKPYLNPDLTLSDLAKLVNIPPRSVSSVLNDCLNQNFYDFINSYRIKESEKLLTENSPKFKTVLEVLYEVGFNSKSSFNSAFKKFNGVTPTQFKRMNMA